MIINVNILIENFFDRKEYLIDVQKGIIDINGTIQPIENDIIWDLLGYFVNWDKEYISNNIIDGEEFFIEIKTSDNITRFHGKGSYPDNYLSFKLFLERLERMNNSLNTK